MSRLSLAGVAAGYGVHEVVTGVSLTVPDGAVVALVGPNGHGKTTLLKALSGLIKTSAGRIEFEQQEITNRRPEAIARMGGSARAPRRSFVSAYDGMGEFAHGRFLRAVP